jgi:hypothetical protein
VHQENEFCHFDLLGDFKTLKLIWASGNACCLRTAADLRKRHGRTFAAQDR